MDYILLLLGFLLLIKGADAFVDGSSSVAKILKIPTIIIGLTVVAFGTSMPEFSVSLTAAMKGSNDLAVSNVLGSNIFNLLVVLGACSLIQPVQAKSSLLKKEFPFSIFIAGFRFLHFQSIGRRRHIYTWKIRWNFISDFICSLFVRDSENGASFQR